MGTGDSLRCVPGLYHFTDIRNLPLIRELKGILCTAKLREEGHEFFAGGNDWSLKQDRRFGMDEYVHLCWATGHPMEWHIRHRDIPALSEVEVSDSRDRQDLAQPDIDPPSLSLFASSMSSKQDSRDYERGELGLRSRGKAGCTWDPRGAVRKNRCSHNSRGPGL
jgi:hypothetical protein